MTNVTVTFEMNGKGYETNQEILDLLRSLVPGAKESGDTSAVGLVMSVCLADGRIREISYK